MKTAAEFWRLSETLLRRSYTWCMRRRFAVWGAESELERHAKLRGADLVAVGRGVYICQNAWLNAFDDRGDGKPTLRIGDGTYIGRFVHINAWRDVEIEDNVLIADRVFISDTEHVYDDPSRPIRLQGDRFKGKVRLETGCWLGVGVVVLPGVTIGRNAIVGANSVVTRNVPPYGVATGAPAKIIRIQNEVK